MFAATNFNSRTMMMKPVPVILMLIMALLVVLGAGVVFPAYADTPLFIGCPEYHSNEGRPYWEIKKSGNYYLAIDEDSFYTNNFFAIRIYASNVVLDGSYKTLTASGPIVKDKDNICGVRVNGGPMIQNVTIKNLNVENKFYGILFESHKYGRVENCRLTRNIRGVTMWQVYHMTLQGNWASNNEEYGLELDGHLDVNNNNNTLTNNTASNNGLAGIILHLENSYNPITGNICNNNGHFGITLPDSSHDNILSGNTTSDNPTGILIQKSYSNVIKGNTITQNDHKGLWLYSANNNTIYNNYFFNLDKNVGFDGTCTGNQWSISKSDNDGPNIVGGPYQGGNFWATPDGSGFSQTTPDTDGDGFCDRSYTIRTGDVDNLPLHEYTVKITPPTVTTSAVSFLTCDTASSGGNVTSSGNGTVTSRGVCWSRSENPTINDSHTNDGTGAGTFQSTITGLDLGATYYVRAYATNSAGTGYGADIPFSTKPFEGIVYVSLDDQTCGANCLCYPTIQDAIDAPYDARTIKIAGGTYTQAITLNESRVILLEGGWNDSFTLQSANTAIKSPSVQTGSMTFRNLTIVP